MRVRPLAYQSFGQKIPWPNLHPQDETVDEVEAVFPVETPQSSIEKDVELFTEQEDDQDETFELPTHEQPPHQPIELKPLPFRLHYAFLNGDTETPVIINDKLSDEETMPYWKKIGPCLATHSKTLRELALPSARIVSL